MPTYTCSLQANKWTAAQKQAIAQAIAVNHSAATGAPPNLVHVVFQEAPGGSRFVGGIPEEEHIWIVGYIRSGRNDETIGRLMLSIMRSVSRITGMDEHFIWIYIVPVESSHMVKYGGVHPQPGGEKAWFASMPEHVRSYMERQTPPESAIVFLDGALQKELNPVGMACFIRQFEQGEDDYTKERDALLGDVTMRDIEDQLRNMESRT